MVVGFSFAEADLYISRMLIKAMQESTKTRMTIVDPDVSVIEKVRRKFEAQIPSFDPESRIIRLQGDCSEILPDFLGGKLFANSDDSETGQSVDGAVAPVPVVSN